MTRLNLTADEVLTTTRAVRKRLDLTRPVPRAVLEECLEIALQAPNGSNRNLWRWMIVDDPALIAKLADEYRAALTEYRVEMNLPPVDKVEGDKIVESAAILVEKLGKVPAMLVPLMHGRPDGADIAVQGAMWGSIIQAVWSFFLALRERGLGSVWATISLRHERQIAELLGIPHDKYTQVGLFPIAYTIGTDFKKAPRPPVSELLSYNRFAG